MEYFDKITIAQSFKSCRLQWHVDIFRSDDIMQSSVEIGVNPEVRQQDKSKSSSFLSGTGKSENQAGREQQESLSKKG